MPDFKGFTGFEGSVFPPELREIVPTIKTLSELKLLLIVLDSYFQAGLDAQPMTFDQLQKRTKLARQSVNDGLKKLLSKGYIQRLSAGDTYAYEPSLDSRLPCHESLSFDGEKLDSHDKEYVHAWQSRIYTALVQEFGVASRVAEDIALNRDPAYVQRHIDYAHYEIKAGFQPKRPAGYIVARIRDDRPMPLGYKAKEEETPKTPTDFGIGQTDPLAGVPPATDRHQRAVDAASGGNGADPIDEIVRHLRWLCVSRDAPMPKGSELRGYRKAARALLEEKINTTDWQGVCLAIDDWKEHPPEEDIWQRDRTKKPQVALDCIAAHYWQRKNGGPHARPAGQLDPQQQAISDALKARARTGDP